MTNNTVNDQDVVDNITEALTPDTTIDDLDPMDLEDTTDIVNTPVWEVSIDDMVDNVLGGMNATEVTDPVPFTESKEEAKARKEAEKQAKEEEKKAKELEKKAKEEEKAKAEFEKKERLANLDNRILELKHDATKKFNDENAYPNIQGTDTKYVLDTFFDRFYQNTEDLRLGKDVKTISVLDIYNYFDRFLGTLWDVDNKAEEMDRLIDKLDQDTTDRDSYKELNFKYFYWTRAIDKEVSKYYELKRVYEDNRITIFNELRQDFSSDTATNTKIDEILQDARKKLEDMKIKTDRRSKGIARFDKIIDFIKSCNIRDMVEAKRMDSMLQNDHLNPLVNDGNV